MRVIKPTWLSHSGEQKDFEVYSCHVSSDGKRLATAGGDGHVRVWSTEAIYGDANGEADGKPRQLCHMSHHLGTIHSVRFSPNSRYLASGADDKLICVYHLDKSPPVASFGLGAEPPPVENWKTYKRLVGHENDVQDLAWSYDSSILVSVGLDSKIVVWSGHSFEKLKTITVHSSHVKGITFDPANKFFATASDDRTIKIFRFTPPAPNATQHDMVNNFVLETTISAPFKSSPLTTYFRRCSWSPDGNHIAAPNAVNGPVSSVAIIERTRWDSEINLIGHEGPTEVCMFSPRLFHTENPADQPVNNALVTVIASAGQDKTLSIWNTNTSRPVVILQDVASKSISDLAWSPDGTTIFAASLDGSVLGIKFDHGELGWVANADENDKALQKYGASRKGMGIAEDVEGLNLESQSKAGESRAAESRMGALMGDAGSSKPSTNGTKTVGNGTGTSTPKALNGNAEPDKDKEKEKEKERPAEENGDRSAERVKELKSRVTVGRDGRKRVAPLLVSSSGTGQSSLPQTQLVGSTSTAKAAQNDAPQTILDLERPFEGLPKGGVAAMLLGNKRKLTAVEGEEEEDRGSKRLATTDPTPVVLNGVDGVEPASVVAASHGVVPTPEYLRPAVLNPSIAFAQIRLAVPKVRSHILRPLERGVLLPESSTDEASKVPENTILEARNPVQIRDPSSISATKRGTLLWQDYLPRAVILVTGNKQFWAAACEDGSIYTWTPAGRRLMNPIIMESQPVILECRNSYLLCINAVGLCHVWDLQKQAALHPPVSLGPVLELATTTLNLNATTPGPGVTSAQLNSTGHIVVTLTNGDGYYYTRDMFSWQRVSEAWWAVGSQYWNSNDSSISALQSTAVGPVTPAKPKDESTANVSAGIIPYLERHTTNEFLLKGRAYTLQRIVKLLLSKDGFEGFESTVSIAHLENRIAAALHLDARDEFRLYLFMYAKRLGAEGHRGKVEELLNSLLGGILKDKDGKPSDGGRGWFSQEEEICGWDRKELLKGVVMILGKFRELQRLTIQYARVLDLNLESDGAMEVES
ncbi:WD domain-containing protein [Colletotrichum falcatum]|nr:WD domain-containing protein [Colletotrichum falcatum]